MELLTMNEVCKELRINRETFSKMIKNNEISVIKVGKKNLFKRDDVDNFIESKRSKKEL